MKRFTVGEVYFKVYFFDSDLTYLSVGAYVFLGMDLQGGESVETWYFQDCESFARFGSFMNETKGAREILGLDRIATEDVTDLAGLMAELTRAAARRANGQSRNG